MKNVEKYAKKIEEYGYAYFGYNYAENEVHRCKDMKCYECWFYDMSCAGSCDARLKLQWLDHDVAGYVLTAGDEDFISMLKPGRIVKDSEGMYYIEKGTGKFKINLDNINVLNSLNVGEMLVINEDGTIAMEPVPYERVTSKILTE